MIPLHPIPKTDHTCPQCQFRLEPRGWYIPGMRTLADLVCPKCGREFYGDLPAGHGLYYPMLLERATGVVHDRQGVEWFSSWLRDSYSNRIDSPIGFDSQNLLPLKRPVLLNCLDRLYGHCVLKLLNAQYYLDQHPDVDLVVLVPLFLRWMVPDGAAAIWTVDLPLSRGTEWNDWLATELNRRISAMSDCWLSVGLSHPHPGDYDIERFTRVRPFQVEKWDTPSARPTVTFIWREDRAWSSLPRQEGSHEPEESVTASPGSAQESLNEQREKVIGLAQALHDAFSQTDFAVAGLGEPEGLPAWVADLRTRQITDAVERSWCERYAKSHVVIGIHGSNMLLPSAHAGAVIELVPPKRWDNLVQDMLPTAGDVREAMYRYHFLPLAASPTTVSEIAASLLRRLPYALLNFKRPWVDHEAVGAEPWLIEARRRKTGERLAFEKDYQATLAENRELKLRLTQLQDSRSWKVTKPLRLLAEIAQGPAEAEDHAATLPGNRRLRLQLAQLHDSSSWRLTAPIRRISERVKGLRH